MLMYASMLGTEPSLYEHGYTHFTRLHYSQTRKRKQLGALRTPSDYESPGQVEVALAHPVNRFAKSET